MFFFVSVYFFFTMVVMALQDGYTTIPLFL